MVRAGAAAGELMVAVVTSSRGTGGLEAAAGNRGGVRSGAESCTGEHLQTSAEASIGMSAIVLWRRVVEWRGNGGLLDASLIEPLAVTQFGCFLLSHEEHGLPSLHAKAFTFFDHRGALFHTCISYTCTFRQLRVLVPFARETRFSLSKHLENHYTNRGRPAEA